MASVTDVNHVTELFDPKEVNKHLDKGWTLLAVHPNTTENSKHPNVYVLGDTPLAADMKDILEVDQVSSTLEVSHKIDEGWVLLKVLQNTESDSETWAVIYVMGKPLRQGVRD